MSDPVFNALLREALDEVKQSHAEINRIRKLAEAWITDSMELTASSWEEENAVAKTAALAAVASCGRAALAQLRHASMYTEDG